jgi:hypothetical protein
VTSPE